MGALASICLASFSQPAAHRCGKARLRVQGKARKDQPVGRGAGLRPQALVVGVPRARAQVRGGGAARSQHGGLKVPGRVAGPCRDGMLWQWENMVVVLRKMVDGGRACGLSAPYRT